MDIDVAFIVYMGISFFFFFFGEDGGVQQLLESKEFFTLLLQKDKCPAGLVMDTKATKNVLLVRALNAGLYCRDRISRVTGDTAGNTKLGLPVI